MSIILVIVIGMLTQSGDYSTTELTLHNQQTMLLCEQVAQLVIEDEDLNQPYHHIVSATCIQE